MHTQLQVNYSTDILMLACTCVFSMIIRFSSSLPWGPRVLKQRRRRANESNENEMQFCEDCLGPQVACKEVS